ncbi:MAG: adenine phosphoribosyltransferase [Candidatus Eisenbacteria bacterium]|nr:adenine phosphoribosyltransferase [Candidatus Eisenbacteria bacterium]
MPEPREESLKAAIRDVPDFPKPGILFRDITPLLLDPLKRDAAVTALWTPFQDAGVQGIAGIESRGFIFGACLAMRHQLPLILIRKEGKLPSAVHREAYLLEYGEDAVEMHQDAVAEGRRILLVDDLLATGGTAAAAVRLIQRAGGQLVGASFLVELTGLQGRKLLEGCRIHTVIRYEGA